MLPSAPPPPHVLLMQMMTGSWLTHVLSVIAKLSIADLIADQPKTAEQLAHEAGAHPGALYRVMRAAASLGVLAEDAEGRFHNTPMSDHLRWDHPNSLRGFAIFLGAPFRTNVFAETEYSVRTGLCASEEVLGMGGFQWLSQHPEEAEIFDNAMTSISMLESPVVVASYDYSQFDSIVDVAGGYGLFLSTILHAAPKLSGTVFDLPHVIERAKSHSYLAGFEGRAHLVPGDMFASVPSGASAYTMKYIIHDWPDGMAEQILVNCRKASAPKAKLLVVDQVVPSGNTPSPSKLMDIEMLVMAPNGKERTEAEFRALFQAAGWRLSRIIPTACPLSIIEGVQA